MEHSIEEALKLNEKRIQREELKKNFDSMKSNDELMKAFRQMEDTSKHLFITGRAGTGKSTLLKYFVGHTRKKVVVLAPTGLAALNVDGQTIHSFFRFPHTIIEQSHVKRISRPGIYQNLDAIIIDEISMVRADMFDAIDIFMRKNGRNPSRPFGGAQLILFGDMFQLPPVVTNEDKNLLGKFYDTPYFFSANAMHNIELHTIELSEVYRQSDPVFVGVLDLIRKGASSSEILKPINLRVDQNFSDDADYIILTTTNALVNAKNQKRLDELQGEAKVYQGIIDGDFNKNSDSLPVDYDLKLKTQAKVIFARNDPDGRWVNGSLGIITGLSDDAIKVKLLDSGEIVSVKRVTWEKVKYEYDLRDDKIETIPLGRYTQFPLRLAWAITIHKSQGQTFGKVVIDLSSGAFSHGQTYVALSRCRTLQGIVLKRHVWPSDVIVDKQVVDFLDGKRGKMDLRDFQDASV